MTDTAPHAALLLADGFEEIEAITLVDVLRRGEVRVSLVGVFGAEARGAHGVVVRADTVISDVGDAPFDAVVLPGGMPGARHLRDEPAVQALVDRQHRRGGLLAAICAAPIALGRAGALQGRAATCYPGFEDGLLGASVRAEAVVEDGAVITSRGPATAMAFALTLLRRLRGPEVAASVARDLLVEA